ncbi:MAG: hypothetical protein ACMV1B_09125 [Prevotella sp.]
MIPIIAGLVSMLADKGLDLISSAIDGGADKAKEYIEDKTGIKLDKNLTDEQVAELKKFEMTNKIELEKLALANKQEDNRHAEKKTEIITADKSNARNREIEVVKVTGKKDNTVTILAGVIVIGFFAGLISLVFVHLDKGSGTYELLYMMFGALIAKFGTVIDYFFGASETK